MKERAIFGAKKALEKTDTWPKTKYVKQSIF